LRRALILLSVLILAVALPGPAAAQSIDLYTFSVTALGGLGGSLESDNGGLGNSSYQLGFSTLIEDRTRFGVRVGKLEVEMGEETGLAPDGEFTYLTLAGEYRFTELSHDSGIFLGLGAYRFEGDTLALEPFEETNIGLTVGATGEFELADRWGLLLELNLHFLDFSQSRVMAHGLAGVAYHF
jgi:hypothetical protein